MRFKRGKESMSVVSLSHCQKSVQPWSCTSP